MVEQPHSAGIARRCLEEQRRAGIARRAHCGKWRRNCGSSRGGQCSPYRAARLVLLAICSFTIFSSVSFAQETQPAGPEKAVLDEQASRIENEIAVYLQRRGEAAAADLPVLDLQIDLRVIERALLRRAADAKTDEPIQSCALLRAENLQWLGGQLATRLNAAKQPLSQTQLDGLKRVHQLSYKLPDLKSVSALDDLSKTLAMDLILAAGPTQADTRNFPPMRPEAPATQPASVPSAKSPPTLAQLTARARALAVSDPLHRQLLAVASAAASAASDPKQHEDAGLLRDELAQAIDLAEMLQQASGVDPMAKAQAEQQLADALALLSDVRTRAAGKSRLAALQQTRETLAKTQRLKLLPEAQEKLAPALSWAHKHPEEGPKMLKMIDQFEDLWAREDGSHDAGTLAPNARRFVDAMQKQLASRRESFLQDASQLGAGGSAGSTPANLRNHLDQMQQARDNIQAVERLSKSIQILSAYKPRPYAALERRATVASNELAGNVSSDRRDQAIKFIQEADRLAQLAQSFDAITTGIPPEAASTYAGGRLEAAEARRQTLIAELASELAAGRPLARAQVTQLQTYHAMLESLHACASVESALDHADALTRWVDWTITPDRARAMLAPYRDATTAAFEGFAGGNTTPISRWEKIHRNYAALLDLFRQAAEYDDACAKLPTGYFADCAKLMTPMDAQPFAIERHASFYADLWSRATDAGDTDQAGAVLEAFFASLNREP